MASSRRKLLQAEAIIEIQKNEVPGKFVNVDDASALCREYVDGYNNTRRHSGIAYLTPAEVHAGKTDEALRRRHEVTLAAIATHSEFVRGLPHRETLAPAVFINPPSLSIRSCHHPRRARPRKQSRGSSRPPASEEESARLEAAH